MSHHKKRRDTNNPSSSNLTDMLNNVDLNDILSKYSKSEEDNSDQEYSSSQTADNNVNAANLNDLLNNVNINELLASLSMNAPRRDYSYNMTNYLAANPTVNLINSIRPFVNKRDLPILDQLIRIYALGTLLSGPQNKSN